MHIYGGGNAYTHILINYMHALMVASMRKRPYVCIQARWTCLQAVMHDRMCMCAILLTRTFKCMRRCINASISYTTHICGGSNALRLNACVDAIMQVYHTLRTSVVAVMHAYT